jgi:hypothetical protein
MVHAGLRKFEGGMPLRADETLSLFQTNLELQIVNGESQTANQAALAICDLRFAS